MSGKSPKRFLPPLRGKVQDGGKRRTTVPPHLPPPPPGGRKNVFNIVAQVCRRFHVDPYLVGGSVRDRLFKRPSQDLDFACRKARKVAGVVARRLAAHLIVLDEQNRIYRIVKGEHKLDFAELQGKTLQEDLARRDFTLNAMACRLGSNRLIDPFKGQRDIRRKVLRAVSRQVFPADPLRLLRAYRLAAQFSLDIEPATRRWIQQASSEFRVSGFGSKTKLVTRNSKPATPVVSAERVREELLRLLRLPHASPALDAMDRGGLLTAIFTDLEAARRVAPAYYGRGGVLKHSLQSVEALEWILENLGTNAGTALKTLRFIPNIEVLDKVCAYCRQLVGGFPRTAFLKLGALLHDIGKPATAQMIRGRLRFFGHDEVGAGMAQPLLEKLRFSRQEVQCVRAWIRSHMRPGNLACVQALTHKAVSRFFRDLGEDGAGMLLIALGDHYTYLRRSQWGKGREALEKTVSRMLGDYYLRPDVVLPPRIVNGRFLMKRLHLKPGPIVGKLLEAIQDKQACGRVKNPEQAVAIARAKIRSLARRTPNEGVLRGRPGCRS